MKRAAPCLTPKRMEYAEYCPKGWWFENVTQSREDSELLLMHSTQIQSEPLPGRKIMMSYIKRTLLVKYG